MYSLAREYMQVRLISFCSFRPDEDQGNPGRNVVSDKKCAGAEGEELALSWQPSKREPVQDNYSDRQTSFSLFFFLFIQYDVSQ